MVPAEGISHPRLRLDQHFVSKGFWTRALAKRERKAAFRERRRLKRKTNSSR
jgi:hypothetical protein